MENKGKSSCRRKARHSKAYEERFVTLHQGEAPQKIVDDLVSRRLATISQIADEGQEEKNRLKAAIAWLRFSRVVSEGHRLEVEGSLSLEARLNEVLAEEKEEDEDKKANP